MVVLWAPRRLGFAPVLYFVPSGGGFLISIPKVAWTMAREIK
jgi:hypothetical protein